MSKTRVMSILGCLLLAVAIQSAVAAGPWKIQVWQSGAPGSRVQAGTEFQIRGEGFHASVLPVKVCVFDSQCQLATVDRAGNFMMIRALPDPGSYEIRVYQAHDMNISGWRLKVTETVTVTN